MSTRTSLAVITVLALSLLIAGCPGQEQQRGDWSGVSINGAGASFPYPIYSQWAFQYEEITGLMINYQSVGSGAGISSIESRTVDFGASDAPLQVEELDDHGLVQFPMIIGGVVLAINVAGVGAGQLRLSRDVFARIYLGEITMWNDDVITSINPDLTLPDMPITVVNRADGSGTTWIFTSCLAAISPDWLDRVGVGKSVEWPVGIGGRGNEGVANYVAQVEGTIGYVEYAYALQNSLTYALLENRDGNYIAPTADSFMAAAANADWASAPGYYMVLVDQPGAETWPIVGASFILIYKEQEDRDTARAMLEFFDWCYRDGREAALELDYVPIPENVIEMVEQTWSDEVIAGGERVW